MAGISKLTALEIFSQPRDLHFVVSEQNGKWAFVISRGPRHNFKPLLSTTPFADSKAIAVQEIANILQGICQAMTQEIANPDSLIAAVTNSNNRPADDATSLSGSDRERIIEDLTVASVAKTYEYA